MNRDIISRSVLKEALRQCYATFNGTPMESSTSLISYRAICNVIDSQPCIDTLSNALNSPDGTCELVNRVSLLKTIEQRIISGEVEGPVDVVKIVDAEPVAFDLKEGVNRFVNYLVEHSNEPNISFSTDDIMKIMIGGNNNEFV